MNKVRAFFKRALEPERRPEEGEEIILDQQGMVDIPFLLLTLILVFIGLITMFSASYVAADYETEKSTPLTIFIKQLIGVVAGLAVLGVVSRFDYMFWRRMRGIIFLGTVALLVLVQIFGQRINGGKRWIELFGVTIQPSEIAKFVIILHFAHNITTFKDKMLTRGAMKKWIAVPLILMLLVAIQPHLSSLIIFVAIIAGMLFLQGVKVRWFVLGAAALGGAVFLYARVFGYAGSRFAGWLDPWGTIEDEGWQVVQSLYAIGSGGLMGLGLGRSRQKYLYLPEVQNDYVFPVVCEELGFVGAVAILLLFAMLIIRGFWIAMHARERFGSLLAAGIMLHLSIQVILNIAVVTNLLPSTGISLPFFSSGLSALLVQLFEMGVMLSVSRYCDSNKLA